MGEMVDLCQHFELCRVHNSGHECPLMTPGCTCLRMYGQVPDLELMVDVDVCTESLENKLSKLKGEADPWEGLI